MSENEPAITMKTCTRCGATWYPRTPGRPVGCAKCHSPYWDKPRVYELRNRAPAKSRVESGTTKPITGASADGNPKGVATANTSPQINPPAVIPTEPPQVPPASGRVADALQEYRRMKAAQRGEA